METSRLELAQRLHVLLEEEFEALKRRDLDLFEQLQPGKARLLEALAAGAHPLEPGAEAADPATPDSPETAEPASPHPSQNPSQNPDPARELLLQCRDAHRRNETLMQRQLEAVRGALQALSAESGLDTVEVYDRLGQMRSRGGGRYTDA